MATLEKWLRLGIEKTWLGTTHGEGLMNLDMEMSQCGPRHVETPHMGIIGNHSSPHSPQVTPWDLQRYLGTSKERPRNAIN